MFTELTIAYLFLGGAGAGTLAVLSVLQIYHGGARFFYRQFKIGYSLAALLLLLGIACLVFDLPKPDKAVVLFLHPTLSIISIGSYLLAASLGISVLFMFQYWFNRFPRTEHATLAASYIGIVIAVLTMMYPGSLLMSMIRNTVWHCVCIPLLFALSSTSTGIAITIACWVFSPSHPGKGSVIRKFLRLDACLIAAETACTVFYLVFIWLGLEGTGELLYLTGGAGFLPFCIGYCGCGLVSSFALSTLCERRAKQELIPLLVALALIGGYCLRVSIVGLQL